MLVRRLLAVVALLSFGSWTRDASLAPAPAVSYEADPRLARLREFLEACHCPAHAEAEQFLRAADTYGLDWRLLPAIALVETGAGKTARGNNLFGWQSGAREFPSVRYGIHWVAWRLARSPLYAGKSLPALLRRYNGDPAYAGRVIAVMRRLASQRAPIPPKSEPPPPGRR